MDNQVAVILCSIAAGEGIDLLQSIHLDGVSLEECLAAVLVHMAQLLGGTDLVLRGVDGVSEERNNLDHHIAVGGLDLALEFHGLLSDQAGHLIAAAQSFCEGIFLSKQFLVQNCLIEGALLCMVEQCVANLLDRNVITPQVHTLGAHGLLVDSLIGVGQFHHTVRPAVVITVLLVVDNAVGILGLTNPVAVMVVQTGVGIIAGFQVSLIGVGPVGIVLLDDPAMVGLGIQVIHGDHTGGHLRAGTLVVIQLCQTLGGVDIGEVGAGDSAGVGAEGIGCIRGSIVAIPAIAVVDLAAVIADKGCRAGLGHVGSTFADAALVDTGEAAGAVGQLAEDVAAGDGSLIIQGQGKACGGSTVDGQIVVAVINILLLGIAGSGSRIGGTDGTGNCTGKTGCITLGCSDGATASNGTAADIAGDSTAKADCLGLAADRSCAALLSAELHCAVGNSACNFNGIACGIAVGCSNRAVGQGHVGQLDQGILADLVGKACRTGGAIDRTGQEDGTVLDVDLACLAESTGGHISSHGSGCSQLHIGSGEVGGVCRTDQTCQVILGSGSAGQIHHQGHHFAVIAGACETACIEGVIGIEHGGHAGVLELRLIRHADHAANHTAGGSHIGELHVIAGDGGQIIQALANCLTDQTAGIGGINSNSFCMDVTIGNRRRIEGIFILGGCHIAAHQQTCIGLGLDGGSAGEVQVHIVNSTAIDMGQDTGVFSLTCIDGQILKVDDQILDLSGAVDGIKETDGGLKAGDLCLGHVTAVTAVGALEGMGSGTDRGDLRIRSLSPLVDLCIDVELLDVVEFLAPEVLVLAQCGKLPCGADVQLGGDGAGLGCGVALDGVDLGQCHSGVEISNILSVGGVDDGELDIELAVSALFHGCFHDLIVQKIDMVCNIFRIQRIVRVKLTALLLTRKVNELGILIVADLDLDGTFGGRQNSVAVADNHGILIFVQLGSTVTVIVVALDGLLTICLQIGLVVGQADIGGGAGPIAVVFQILQLGERIFRTSCIQAVGMGGLLRCRTPVFLIALGVLLMVQTFKIDLLTLIALEILFPVIRIFIERPGKRDSFQRNFLNCFNLTLSPGFILGAFVILVRLLQVLEGGIQFRCRTAVGVCLISIAIFTQIIAVTENVSINHLRLSAFLNSNCSKQTIIVVGDISIRLGSAEVDTGIGTGESFSRLGFAGTGGFERCTADGIALGHMGGLSNGGVAAVVAVAEVLVHRHDAHKAADAALGAGACNRSRCEALAVAGTMAGADEAAGTDADTAVIGQVQRSTQQSLNPVQERLPATAGAALIFRDIQTRSLDVTAGITVEEVGQLGVADEAADTVGISIVLLFITAHLAADIDGCKAVLECQMVGTGAQLLAGSTVGLGIADQAADSAGTADAVPILGCSRVIVTMAHIGSIEIRILGIDINTAVADHGVVAGRTDQSAGGGVAVHGDISVANDGVARQNAVPS